MMHKKMAFCVMLLSLITPSANAGLFSGMVNGTFGNGVSAPDNQYEITNGGANFEWGIRATGFEMKNRFTFTGFGFSNIMENMTFAISDFYYQNGSTYNGTGISSVKLAINMMITYPVIENALFDYYPAIISTPNIEVDDGKSVTIASMTSPELLTCPGSNRLLNLPGFSSDGGTTTRTDFSSPEGSCESAQLFTSIVTAEPANVPEPGTLSLFILGLTFLGSLTPLRRKN